MTITLTLKALTFNRRTGSGSRPAAIPIRATLIADTPDQDWVGPNAGQATPVAYALSMTAADIADLRITATFTAATPLTSPIFIRAVDDRSRLLGDVDVTRFGPSDVGQEMDFHLTGGQLGQAAIDAHTIHWRWEWSADGRSNWQGFADSEHVVYAIVDRLKAPWGRSLRHGDPHTVVPWNAVMEQACKWGKGLRREDDVVEAMTVAIDGLAGTPIGTGVVRYHNWASLTVGQKFRVSDILLIVRRIPNAPKTLNCQDINTAIAMFSTILGCDVRVLRLQPNGTSTINTNAITVFGRKNATNERFGYHEVAARPGVRIDERPVWDACLQIDADSNPAASPHSFELPIGLRVQQTARDLGYRVRLLDRASQNCIVADAQVDGLRYPNRMPEDGPATRALDPFYKARQLSFLGLMTDVPISGRTGLDLLARFEKWLAGVSREDFRREFELDTVDPPTTVLFTPLSPVVTGGSPMLAEVYMAPVGAQAVDLFLALAANYTGTLTPCKVGDFGLEDPGKMVLFLRGPIVACLFDANDEIDAPANFNAAVQLDEQLKPLLAAPVPVPTPAPMPPV